MANFLCPIHQSSQHFPNSIALFDKEKNYTYQEVDRLIAGLKSLLQEKGVRPNQRIAFLAKNTRNTILLFFALFRLKAIACPLNPKLPPQRLHEAIEELDAHFFLDPESLSFDPHEEEGLEPYEEGQLATFLFTSGTTGSPKIACHSIGNHVYSALGSNAMTGFNCSDCWLMSLPLFHVGGIAILFRTFFVGGKLALSDDPILTSLIAYPITFLSLVPTQLFRILKTHEDAFQKAASQLKCILLGGAPIPLALFDEALEKKLPIRPTYGMTEMSSQITMNITPKHGRLSAGIPLPFSKITLSPEGEILVKGKTLFQGYWNKEKGLILDVDEEGWFQTKDRGSWREEALIYLGRKDEMFISGGENIQPEEIENALLTLQGIVQAIVVPAPDDEFGARPAAFIQDESKTHTLATIQEALRQILPSFKIPIAVYPIPIQESFKLGRNELKEIASQGKLS